MSDIMRPISFGNLIDWIYREYTDHKSIFGIFKIVKHSPSDHKLPIFNEKLESPFGPAAGPHTQLAQNIIAAYAAGSRFFELKTVQKMDGEELSKCVAKPCITAQDECYNCEWSTELYVPQAYAEYVKAWFALKIFSKEFGLGDPDAFVFNMSVGYDLEGIQTEKIDKFIEGMKDASGSPVWEECVNEALAYAGNFKNVDEAYIRAISPKVSDSITLSTLHGCPPQEIERIASYLINEKHLNTYIKCNPTLLGYECARSTLDSLGFDYIAFDDHHFKEDLQFSDAVPMLQRLQKQADDKKLSFGVKLTNTFPVDVKAGELPSEEMYMSGRSLYPLSLTVAQKLTETFHGKLRISYSGGADFHNIKELFDAGIWPITMATTMLKPGGYQRLVQITEILGDCGSQPFDHVDLDKVQGMLAALKEDPYYHKPIKPAPPRKLNAQVPLIDCFTAPCRSGCPIEQDIPAYLRLVGQGKYQEALQVVTQRNPLPFITGTICSHRCMDKCTRNFYEESIHIRSAKLQAAKGGYDGLLAGIKAPAQQAGKNVAVVGAGPAGISAAFFLARAGVPVTVFEEHDAPGGIVRHVIPGFRVDNEAIEKDVALAKAYGAKFQYNTKVKSIDELKAKGYTHVIVAAGAWKPGVLRLETGEAMNVIAFLEQFKKDPSALQLGTDVVIIGGGNTAMDAARAAKRVPGVQNVRLVYRRDQRNMPADEEELELAIQDGVEFCPLLAPAAFQDGKLSCHKMALGEPDASGRRTPVDTGKLETVPATAVIAAVGEKVDDGLYQEMGIAVNERGRAKTNPETLETNLSNVYVIGDGNHGPATVVEAIADASKAVKAISNIDLDRYVQDNIIADYQKPLAKKGVLCKDCSSCQESDRCLGCATVCECCTDVCPNRANIAVSVPGKRMRQIIHMDGMCNECGNCKTFCPYDSAPYQDKFTLFWSQEDFDNSKNEGFLLLDKEKQTYRVRFAGKTEDYAIQDSGCKLTKDLRDLIAAAYQNYSYLF